MARERKSADVTPQRVRLVVRIDPAGVPRGMVCPTRRIRAGLTITREPQVVQVTPEQAEALKADPMLAVAEAGE